MDWDVEAELESIPVLPSPSQSTPVHASPSAGASSEAPEGLDEVNQLPAAFAPLLLGNQEFPQGWQVGAQLPAPGTGIFAAGDLGRRGGTSGYRTQRGRVLRRKELDRNDVTFHQLGAKLKTQSSRSENPEATRR